MQLSAIWSVFQFERKRTATTTRWLWWSILCLFPVAITLFIKLAVEEPMPFFAFSMMLFYLVPAVVCVMGQLLWATPSVQSELEGKTWSYLAIRPHGKIHVLLGKYITSVTWTFLAALICLTIVLFITTPKVSHYEQQTKSQTIKVPTGEFDANGNSLLMDRTIQRSSFGAKEGGEITFDDRLKLWGTMVALSLFSCLNYGALFVLIGTLVPRRAMVIAIVYTVIFEIIVGFIPAIINQLTIQFRLRSLLMEWDGGLLKESLAGNPVFESTTSQWQHIGILVLLFPFLLAAAAYILHKRELIASEDVN